MELRQTRLPNVMQSNSQAVYTALRHAAAQLQGSAQGRIALRALSSQTKGLCEEVTDVSSPPVRASSHSGWQQAGTWPISAASSSMLTLGSIASGQRTTSLEHQQLQHLRGYKSMSSAKTQRFDAQNATNPPQPKARQGRFCLQTNDWRKLPKRFKSRVPLTHVCRSHETG